MAEFNRDDIVDGVLNYAAGMEITNSAAIVTLTVDATLRYVVGWLDETGRAGLAGVLETLADLD